MTQIPKLITIIWIGDETKRPDDCIQSWRSRHPGYEFRVLGNDDYKTRDWKLKPHMDIMWNAELCGVADLMRWEILASEGGITVDADSFALQSLPQWLHECESFCASENEVLRNGMVTNAFVGSRPGNPFFGSLVDKLSQTTEVLYRQRSMFHRRKLLPAWKSVGPRALTRHLIDTKYEDMTVLPSHFFTPSHFDGFEYNGGGPIYARQLFASTIGNAR
jgi:mannosyltransferase OCH1-like enzyme